MTTLSFPTSPSLNQTYTFGTKTWLWNGTAWQLQTSGAINNLPIGNTIPSTGSFSTLSGANITGGIASITGNIQAGNVSATFLEGTLSTAEQPSITSVGNLTSLSVVGDTIAGNIIPSANVAYSLGNATNQWASVYVGANTLYINSVPVTVDGNTLQVAGANVVTTPGSTLSEISNGNSYANISDPDGNLVVNINGPQWIFDDNGSLNLPGGGPYGSGFIQTANSYPTTLAYGSAGHGGPEWDWTTADSPDNAFGNSSILRNTMYLNGDGLYVGINANGNTDVFSGNLTFDSFGTLTAPGDIIGDNLIANTINSPLINFTSTNTPSDAVARAIGPVLQIAGNITTNQNTLELGLDGGDTFLSANTNIGLSTGIGGTNYYWQFGNTGQLTLPNTAYVDTGIATLLTTQDFSISAGDPQQVWNFSQAGNLTFPDGSIIDNGQWSSNNGIVLQTHDTDFNLQSSVTAGASGQASIHSQNDSGSIQLTVTTDSHNNNITIVNNSNTWTFDNVGNLTLPGNTSSINYANGSPYGGSGGSYGNANVAAYLPTYSGNIGGGNIGVSGAINATGEITSFANIVVSPGGYFQGDGSQLTNLPVQPGTYGNSNVTTFLADFGSNSISTSGNITVGGNVTTAGQLSATGNVSGGNLAITNNAVIIGNLQVRGNVTFINSNAIVTNDLFIELANNQSTYANINNAGLAVGPSGSALTYWQYNTGANAWTTNVNISATSNVIGANILTAGQVSATANITGGNIFTSGIVSSTGNITGNYYIGNGSQLTGITNINNGTSNIIIATANGAITGSVDGISTLYLGANTVAIGSSAGNTGQGANAIAIGYQTGNTNQGIESIALGFYAGWSNQGGNAIGIGRGAGQTTQGIYGVAIGGASGVTNQGNYAVAVGGSAGFSNQGANTVAIGLNAGSYNQGVNSVAIGNFAGHANAAANSIVINASGNVLDSTNAGFYVSPVRNDTGNVTQPIYYNSSTNELTYGGSRIEGEPHTPPVLTNFTAVNQGSATFTQRSGYISMFTSGTSGDNMRMLVQTCPSVSTTWSAILKANFTDYYAGYNRCGIVLYDTVSGKAKTFGSVSSNGNYVNLEYWNSPTSFNVAPYSGLVINLTPQWFKIACDGTNFTCYISGDGYQWVGIYTDAVGNFVTPNRVGFYIESVYSSGIGCSAGIVSWSVG